MFYSQFILSKKGPLGTIWIAAHLERKLRKNQVNETDIVSSVDSIMFPEVPIALRLSGHLLLGVVRIYSRKVTYLFHDCNDALTKLKSAFNVSAASVDLPPESNRASLRSITLPEAFEFDIDFLPNKENQSENVPAASPSFDKHITDRDQITLQEPIVDDLPTFDSEERFTPSSAPVPDRDQRRHLGDSLEEDVLPPMPEAAIPPDTPLTSNTAEMQFGQAPDSTVSDVERLRSVANAVEDDFMDFEKEPEVPNANATIHSPERQLAEDDRLQTPHAAPTVSVEGVENNELLGRPLDVVETPVAKRRKLNPKRRKRKYDEAVQLDKDYYQLALEDTSDLIRSRDKMVTIGNMDDPLVPGLCPGLRDLYAGSKRLKKPPLPPKSRADKASSSKTPHSPEAPEAPEAAEAPEAPEEAPDASHQAPKALHQSPVASPQSPKALHRSPEGLLFPESPQSAQAPYSAGPSAAPQSPTSPYSADANSPATFAAPEPDDTPGPGLSTPQYARPSPGEQSPGIPLRSDAGRAGELRSKAAQERLSDKMETATEHIEPEQEYEGAIDSSVLMTSNDMPSSSGSGDTVHGWSGRTRAIAQFFRATFEAMPSDSGEPPKVSLNRVLGGKNRREAARMFFEVLVLRTNDYIGTQQTTPYEDVDIYAKAKLMKAAF